MVAYCEDIRAQLPVSFVLGFFVSGVIGRWFQTFIHIPWLHEITYNVMAAVNYADPRVSRRIRLSVMRYLNLAWILTMRRISDRIADRFRHRTNKTAGTPKPDDKLITRGRNDLWSVSHVGASHRGYKTGTAPDTLVQATFGMIILENEIKAFERIAKQHYQKTHQRYIPEAWVPLQWAVRLINKAGIHANISDPKLIPTVTKVAVISVYSYFLCQIVGTQYVERNDTVHGSIQTNIIAVPIFGIFYFLFLMGWLKVALCVMNPFGDDYEDFECSEILDFNLDVSYRAVLLDEATYPESLKVASFVAKPMQGAEEDNLQDFLDNATKELQEKEFNEAANE
ncbi:unnamed protein product [Dibothriocephalus latus]|uniref:Bestrophin homolog n=1 Tax=Dibothriocephalus latus TaxID=60516 RepID=A0A3P6UCP9_DIBLA|nr:unnamed protein product [Dibothriocephalus latus]